MKRLSLTDDALLRAESRRQPLHIAMLMLFQPPPGTPDFAARLGERLRQSVRAVEPFNQRLVRRRGLHYWKPDDGEFDLAHHFVHTSLPKPGRIRELLAMVSRVHCAHLDRAYPLWRIYLIEGIEDGSIAVYFKIHHAVADGVGCIRMLMNTMSTDPAVSITLPPPWEVPLQTEHAQASPVPTPAAGAMTALRSLARERTKAIAPLVRELRTTWKDYRAKNPDLVVAGQAPRCLFNAKVSGSRRFAAQSYSTPRMRAVAKAGGASLNDVVLAMCSGALRRYLEDRNELPDRPLIGAIPVSTRQDDSVLGNSVSFTMAPLATHIADPAGRLAAISSAMTYNKERMKRLSPGTLVAYAGLTLIPGAVQALLGRAPDSTLANVCISHVPGPREDLYWQGARLTGLYPVSVVTDSGALNITIVSRHDTTDFGLIACRKTVPHVQRLLTYLEDALADLENAYGLGKAA